jgi:hypothetical protein
MDSEAVAGASEPGLGTVAEQQQTARKQKMTTKGEGGYRCYPNS